MTTLTLRQPLGHEREVRVDRINVAKHRPFVDHGRRYGRVEPVPDPPPVQRVVLTLQALQRHNTLLPILQPTHRVFLRWGETEGSGMPNPEADVRETHFSPLPPEVAKKVSAIVTGSPWETFIRKFYRTDLSSKQLAEVLCVSRTQLYSDWRSSLWYYRGRFEPEKIYG